MQGRHGTDELSRFLNILALVLIILSFFSGLWAPLGFLYWVALAALIYFIFRMMSKNSYKREIERDKFLELKRKVLGKANVQKRRFAERKTHVYFTCPKCHATVRVPRGKGNIQITCPKCKEQFIKRT